MDAIESTAQRHRAMAHPARHRVLIALGQAPATVSQLAGRLGLAKGSVLHHLDVLARADLVRRGATRQVRGGTEQYWERIVERIKVDGDEVSTRALLDAVASEIGASPSEPFLHLRHVRMTKRQAADLRRTLDRLVADAEAAGPRANRHGVLVSLYELAP